MHWPVIRVPRALQRHQYLALCPVVVEHVGVVDVRLGVGVEGEGAPKDRLS